MAKEDLKNNGELKGNISKLRIEDIKKLDTSESNKSKLEEYFEYCSNAALSFSPCFIESFILKLAIVLLIAAS